MRSFLVFLGRFASNPRSVGAVAPSSRFLARKMVDLVPWDPGARVVELGPGTGAFTGEILERLPPGGRYLGIEREKAFVELLECRFDDADLILDSAARLHEILAARQLLPVDHIISGLPFASFPESLTGEILEAMLESVRPGGTFTTFQYVHAYPLPAARFFRRRMQEAFGPIRRRRVELRNLPPAFAFSWDRP